MRIAYARETSRAECSFSFPIRPYWLKVCQLQSSFDAVGSL